MRIGILGFLHESNTFVAKKTMLANFRADLFLEGDSILQKLSESHHEIGGFISTLRHTTDLNIELVPLVVYRATPAGPIEKSSFVALTERILQAIDNTPPLDGLLIAAHGAAVAEDFPDADGDWLTLVRSAIGERVPMITTLDPHANLSQRMVEACTALIAYRTNPHLDQRQRGEEAANMLLQTLRGNIRPIMRASFPSLVINIERQLTSAEPLASLFRQADRQRQEAHMLSNSIFLGFPYSDVPKMGAAALAITDGNETLAQQAADELAAAMWQKRSDLQGVLISTTEAIQIVTSHPDKRYCLLDMGDNVGGGSAADGTTLAQALMEKSNSVGKSFVCIYDPKVVAQCVEKGVGNQVAVKLGGKSDSLHGEPLELTVDIISVHDGKFQETLPRHGGIMDFDQGSSVVVKTHQGELTLLITSKRMVPFSLEQMRSCGLDPLSFRILVAKGVHAPVAAYQEVCDEFIRVNTPGSTSADLFSFPFVQRRRPLYPFEESCTWKPESTTR